MQSSVIEQAWLDYCNTVLNSDPVPENNIWTVTLAEASQGNGGPRPQKPYVTLKIISGPGRITIDDELRNKENTDEFYLVGQRSYTLSIKSYGAEYIDGLSDITTCFDDPDIVQQLKNDADISVTNKGTVSDISGVLETGYEKRGTLDIFFNSSNNKLTSIGPIERTLRQVALSLSLLVLVFRSNRSLSSSCIATSASRWS